MLITLTFHQISESLISIHPSEQWDRKHPATRPESKQQLFEGTAKSTVSISTSSFRLLRMPSGDVPGSFSNAAGWYSLIKPPSLALKCLEKPEKTLGGFQANANSELMQMRQKHTVNQAESTQRVLNICWGAKRVCVQSDPRKSCILETKTLWLQYCRGSPSNPRRKLPPQLYYQRLIHLSVMSSPKHVSPLNTQAASTWLTH